MIPKPQQSQCHTPTKRPTRADEPQKKIFCLTIIFCLDNRQLKGISFRLRFWFKVDGASSSRETNEFLLKSGYCLLHAQTQSEVVLVRTHTPAPNCTQYNVQPNIWISSATFRCSLSSLKLGYGSPAQGIFILYIHS